MKSTDNRTLEAIATIYIVCIIWVMIAGFLLSPYLYNDCLPPSSLEPQGFLDWLVRIFFWPFYLCSRYTEDFWLISLNLLTSAFWGAGLAKLITLVAARTNRVYRTEREQ